MILIPYHIVRLLKKIHRILSKRAASGPEVPWLMHTACSSVLGGIYVPRLEAPDERFADVEILPKAMRETTNEQNASRSAIFSGSSLQSYR